MLCMTSSAAFAFLAELGPGHLLHSRQGQGPNPGTLLCPAIWSSCAWLPQFLSRGRACPRPALANLSSAYEDGAGPSLSLLS